MTEEKNVKSLREKALDIIEIVSNEQQDASLSRNCETDRTAEEHCSSADCNFTGRGYLEKTEAGSYKIGLKLFEVVSCYINNLELQTEARPYIAELTSHLGLTSYLGILDGNTEVVYIEKLDAVSSMKCIIRSDLECMPTVFFFGKMSACQLFQSAAGCDPGRLQLYQIHTEYYCQQRGTGCGDRCEGPQARLGYG